MFNEKLNNYYLLFIVITSEWHYNLQSNNIIMIKRP